MHTWSLWLLFAVWHFAISHMAHVAHGAGPVIPEGVEANETEKSEMSGHDQLSAELTYVLRLIKSAM